MVIVCSENDKERFISHAKDLGEECFEIGKVIEGNTEIFVK